MLRGIHISFLKQDVLLLGKMGLPILQILFITLLLLTRICESCTINKVCWLLLVTTSCNYHSYTSHSYKDTNSEENQKIIVHNAQDSSHHIPCSVHVCVLIIVSLILFCGHFCQSHFCQIRFLMKFRKI